jgi:hypothetical protein
MKINHIVLGIILVNISLFLFLTQHLLTAVVEQLKRINELIDIINSYGYEYIPPETIFWFFPMDYNEARVLLEICFYSSIVLGFLGVLNFYLYYFKKR